MFRMGVVVGNATCSLYIVQYARSRDNVCSDQSVAQKTEELFDSREVQEIYLLFKASRSNPEHT
jgi:hypothetical protein